MNATSTDRIEKQMLLRAPRARVWRAIANAEEFGAWFGVKVEGIFAPGVCAHGKITHKGYEHLRWEITIEKLEPERILSFRWHTAAIEPGVDYSGEPTTLVVFKLEEVAEGTMLTVVESGFDQIPLARRANAYRLNDQGWAAQMKAIEQYVARG